MLRKSTCIETDPPINLIFFSQFKRFRRECPHIWDSNLRDQAVHKCMPSDSKLIIVIVPTCVHYYPIQYHCFEGRAKVTNHPVYCPLLKDSNRRPWSSARKSIRRKMPLLMLEHAIPWQLLLWHKRTEAVLRRKRIGDG